MRKLWWRNGRGLEQAEQNGTLNRHKAQSVKQPDFCVILKRKNKSLSLDLRSAERQSIPLSSSTHQPG